MQVYKRNGEVENFDKNKIITAINKAFIEVDGILYETETAEDIADAIERFVGLNNYPVPIEKIQDRIEEYLMRSERVDVARAYIRYRYKHEMARSYTDDMVEAISEKLAAKNIQKQNANVDEQSFGGRMGEAGSVVWKKIALDHNISAMASENHLNNEIYIHDLDTYAVGMHNCLTIPFDKLLEKGFNTRQTDVRPAGSVSTAMQLVAVIFQLESLQQFGGVSASHLDWTMVPYVRKSFVKHYIKGLKHIENIKVDNEMCKMWGEDKTKASIEDTFIFEHEGAYKYAMELLEEEIHQAVEGLYHNLNTL
jgi:ribonucleoside-triphosphate reductase